MATRKSIVWYAAILLVSHLYFTDVIPSKRFSCPEMCDCYSIRSKWITDCNNKNLTYIPRKTLDIHTKELYMNNNFLRVLSTFSPSNRVLTLDLAHNMLAKIKNTTFGRLRYLLSVNLSNNLISYVHHHAFKENHRLITIDLHGNRLDQVHGPFLFSNALRNLNLANCRITEISKEFFVNIYNLNRLDLSGNSLEKLNATVFSPLRSLKHLILKNCNLAYISPQAFHGLEGLTRLELSQNKLTSDVDWVLILWHLVRLEYIDLRRAGVVQLSINTFARNVRLQTLELADNKLFCLDTANTLGVNLINLKFLDLSNCKLEKPISRNAFVYATQLQTLILSGNRLISADLSATLSPLTKLVKLSLRQCRLNRLAANTFQYSTNLKELDISRNPLGRRNGSLRFLSVLKSLEYLDMGYSNLEKISARTFSNMTNLKTLILSGNKLQYLEPGSFKDIEDLQVLELNDCGLSSLHNILFFNDFTYYPDLVELRLSNNPIQIPKEGTIFPLLMSYLNNLDMSLCNLKHLPKDFFKLTPNLKKLLLNDNELKGDGDSMKFMEHLTNIHEINLNFNNMVSIKPNVFHRNVKLVSLELIGNPWRCQCFIVDMWNWVASKNNCIDFLDGSAKSNSHKKNKNVNYLMCDYNSHIKIDKSKQPSRFIESASNSRVTWQKYVRNTVCPSFGFTV